MTVFEGDAAFHRYEQSVTRLLASFDEAAEVTLNRRVPGRLSGCSRQVDMLVRGQIFGDGVTAVVECRQGRRAADVTAVERFIGKLLDLDADRGVLYSRSGFTRYARARAAASRQPAIMAVSLKQIRPHIPTQRGNLPPHGADELTEADFALFLWPCRT